MQKLPSPYRHTPADAKCYFQNENSRFFHALHQQNLFLRHYLPEPADLLSVLLVCRTLALPGDWHRRVNPGFLNITYINSGETLVRIGNNSFLAEAGDLLLLPPGEDYEFGTGKKAVRSGIVVQGSIIGNILQKLRGKYIFSGNEAQEVLPVIERFFQPGHADEHQLAVWCFELLSALKNNDAGIHLPQLLHKIVQKMQKNLESPLKLDELAASAGISPRTLSRIFQKHFHISPHKYLIRLRMQKACRMLAWEEFSIKETAISCGYPNALNFSTEFKRVMGRSPSEYRLQKNLTVPDPFPDPAAPENTPVI